MNAKNWIAVYNEDRHVFKIGAPDGSMPVATTVNQGDMEQEKSNARLIAAAPELLEACRELIDAIPSADYSSYQIRKLDEATTLACAAIAKAEGH